MVLNGDNLNAASKEEKEFLPTSCLHIILLTRIINFVGEEIWMGSAPYIHFLLEKKVEFFAYFQCVTRRVTGGCSEGDVDDDLFSYT